MFPLLFHGDFLRLSHRKTTVKIYEKTKKNNPYFYIKAMEDSYRQIGERLKGLRDVLNIPLGDIANVCGISEEIYLKAESGEKELPLDAVQRISQRYGIAIDVLLFGEEPRMSSYYVTRKGQGLSIERSKAYKYQSLASGFQNRKMEPFWVLVEPKPETEAVEKRSHEGQEFIAIADGDMELSIGEKVITLHPSDCIYFDSRQPHCMKALNNKPVHFVMILSE